MTYFSSDNFIYNNNIKCCKSDYPEDEDALELSYNIAAIVFEFKRLLQICNSIKNRTIKYNGPNGPNGPNEINIILSNNNKYKKAIHNLNQLKSKYNIDQMIGATKLVKQFNTNIRT